MLNRADQFRKKLTYQQKVILQKVSADVASAVEEEMVAFTNYVMEVHKRLIQAALVRKFRGGNCESQSSLIVAEALLRGYDIEIVQLHEKVPGRNRPKNTPCLYSYGKESNRFY